MSPSFPFINVFYCEVLHYTRVENYYFCTIFKFDLWVGFVTRVTNMFDQIFAKTTSFAYLKFPKSQIQYVVQQMIFK